MMEKLVDFDFAEFVKDPMRLRSKDGTKVVRAAPVWGEVVLANWEQGGSHISYYHPCDYRWLRLAAKTRIVRVRLYRGETGFLYAVTDAYGADLDTPLHGTKQWVGESVAVEIQE